MTRAAPASTPARGPLDDHGGVWDGPEQHGAIRRHELRVAWRSGLESGLMLGAAIALVLVSAAVAAWS